MELIVPIHPDLLGEIVQARQLNTRYETNKKIKFVAAYYVLKSLTTSGVIQDHHAKKFELMQALGCVSDKTFYKILHHCEKLGYLNVTQDSIVLTGYKNFMDLFDSYYSTMVKLRFDPVTQKFHHVMEAAYLQLRERERGKVFENKFKAIPELMEELKTVISADDRGNYGNALQQLQLAAFKYGHEKLKSIFALNPFTTCNSKTMRSMFNFKSEQSVAYLKIKLQRNKLVTVRQQRIPSQTMQRVKHLYIEWDAKTKQTILIMPDKLEYAPFLQIGKN